MVGHGVRERQVLGPGSPGGTPEAVVVVLRRYRCRRCDAVLLVGPRGLLRARAYSAGAIAAALARVAHGATTVDVRHVTSPHRVLGHAARERWITVVRWIAAARLGALFDVGPAVACSGRAVAEHVALCLAARAGPVAAFDLARLAFLGASIAA